MADVVDHIVLFTGDGDFRALVAALQLKGKRVSVISTLQTQPAMVADELRRQADQFIDIADLEGSICRDQPAPRVPRENAELAPPVSSVSGPIVERRPSVSRTPARRAAAVTTSGPASASTLDFPDGSDTK
jgi:hypothetical protein